MQRKGWIAILGLAACLALAGCQLPGGLGKPSDPAAEAQQAGPGDPRPKPRPGSAAPKAAAQPSAANPDAARTPVKSSPVLEPPAPARTPDAEDDLLPQAAEAETGEEEEAASPAPQLPDEIYKAPEPPPVPAALTGQAAQCTKKKGRFVRRGDGGTFVCVQPTRDANKRCDDSSDCDGLCFAKSRTCAPVTPLFGCYDALENGRVVNICTE